MKPEELGAYYESILDEEVRKEGVLYSAIHCGVYCRTYTW